VILAELELRNLRNLERVELTLDGKLNVFLGANGQGKTNLLESIYFLSTQRPLRGNLLRDLIRKGQSESEVKGILRGDLTTHLSLKIAGGRRVAKIDQKIERSVGKWSSMLPVVAFTPDDLSICKGSPSGRRQWIDRVAFSRFPIHLEESRAHQRALAGRNRLLKAERRVSEDELTGFEEVIARHGAMVLESRLKVLLELRQRASERLQEIADSQEALTIEYRSSIFGDPKKAPLEKIPLDALRAGLLDAMKKHRSEDRARGRTTIGPHTDDLHFFHEGHDLHSFGSQGQQRSLVLALKIAEIENLKERLGASPILLLDDVMSELDPKRAAKLTQTLKHFDGQVIMTTTELQHAPIEKGYEARVFEVREGRIKAHEQLSAPNSSDTITD